MKISIVGATGLVGETIIKVLEERNFPVEEIYLFASERSEGKKLKFKNREIHVEEIKKDNWHRGKEIVFFAIDASLSKELLKNYNNSAWIIDNSSAWRLEKNIPLVVPEVNKEILEKYDSKIIANPNCSTIQLVITLKPLIEYKIKRIIVTTMQSVSGKGKLAVEELKYENEFLVLNKKPEDISVFEKQIAGNLIPKIGDFDKFNNSEEERKIMNETKKILGIYDFEIIATCVRVPVFVGHSESVYVEFEKDVNIEEIKNKFKAAEGIIFLEKDFPTPLEIAGKDEVYIGRLRKTEKGITYWCVADNLRKGAATNAVQIAEEIIKKYKNIDKK